jgi:hypothetical protein
MVLYEEPQNRAFCPVTHFLALALADKVLEGCDTFADVKAKEVPAGSESCHYRYKQDVALKPILRTVEPDRSVSSDKILTYSCFSSLIKSLGQRAGYQERLSSYSFRRGYGNAIKSKLLPHVRTGDSN